MQTFFTLVVVVQVLSALAIIGLVLLQHGKGADMGASFGSGASGSLFGATGSSNFLSRSTGVAAALFFIATLSLGVIAGNRKASTGVMDNVSVMKTVSSASASAPAVSASAAQVNQIPK
ncbi:preprotein translocase subunit SecG [Undibacterium jejuense]|uniref:Protein-export membrane protein SecG n=1 Tax=Undibacterium jejuense TaxID=1344949 RepID=A0A923KKH8_9BURK|nr:preprotein translocase subunit SecG [Undibacterium jejuense]MBC3861930.1 preprotein translocase subunit SecG [Undibacterium jejuense]